MKLNMKNVTWKMDDYEKELKRTKRVKKFKKNLVKTMVNSTLFAKATKEAAMNSLAFSGVIGLMSGLKYGGNWKRGVISGVTTLGVISVLSGVSEVYKYRNEVNEQIDKHMSED